MWRLKRKTKPLPGVTAPPSSVTFNRPLSMQGSIALAGVGSSFYVSSAGRLPGIEFAVEHQEDVVDIQFRKMHNYVDKAEAIDRDYLERMIHNLEWTLQHSKGTGGPETEDALDMDLFAKMAGNIIEEAQKLLDAENPTKQQLQNMQTKISGLFAFLIEYPDVTPRKKEVEDGLIIAEDMVKRKTEEGKA